MKNVKVTLKGKKNDYTAIVSITKAAEALFGEPTNITRMSFDTALKIHDYVVSLSPSSKAELDKEFVLYKEVMNRTNSIIMTNGVELYR
jgi:hypothetical protein